MKPNQMTRRTPRRALTRWVGIALSCMSVHGPVTAQSGDTSEVVTAIWNDGVLYVYGSPGDDNLNISSMHGQIEVNGGMTHVVGGTASLDNTSSIVVDAFGGDDHVSLNEFGGALPRAILLGGSGNDLLIGGSNDDELRGGDGNDVLIGNRGNDFAEGQDGSDLLIWNNGDGSDFLEGGAGNDFVQVNGANGAGDDFQVDPDGETVVVASNHEGAAIRIATTEEVNIDGQGGGDVIIASTGLVNLTSLDLDGGEGNDLLIGGDGADVLRGGAGNDTLLGNRGNDVVLGQDGNDLLIVNNGDGSDFLEGGEDIDTVQVNGSNTAGDEFLIEGDGDRVRFQRQNLSRFQLDIGTTERAEVNGQGGSDVIIGSVGLNGLIALELDGGEGNDLLIGSDGADVLRGGRGTDTCDGNGGRDKLISCEKAPR